MKNLIKISLIKTVLVTCLIGHCALAEITVKSNAEDLVISATTESFGQIPEVILHDDFDGGTASQLLTGWSLGSSSGKQHPSYSDAYAVTGKLSGMSDFTNGNFNSSAELKSLPDMDTVYLSYYFKIDKLSGDPSRNIKLARLSGGFSGTYSQAVSFTYYAAQKTGTFQQSTSNGESKVKPVWLSEPNYNSWHRAEMYIKLSNPAGASNGITISKIDGQYISNLVNIVNEETGMRYTWLTLPYYVAHDPGGDYKIYYDNVVISKNQARVETCDSDVYSECARPVVLKHTSWTDKQITVKGGASRSANHRYIYVFNNEGQIINNPGMTKQGIYSCPKSGICPSVPVTSQ